MSVLLACKNEEDPIKMQALEWPRHFSNYKSLKIFQDAQGQITLQSVVRSDRISFYGCPHYLQNKEDPIKNEGNIKHRFFRRFMAAINLTL